MKELILSDGSVCQVSDEDYDYLNQWTWCLGPNGRASRTEKIDSKIVTIYLHLIILARMGILLISKEADHKDRNCLNNQRENLRAATRSQNMSNRDILVTNTSGYKGVSWHNRHSKWMSSIAYQGRTVYLGYFDCPIKAAKTYDSAAKRLHGEFACLNFPNG